MKIRFIEGFELKWRHFSEHQHASLSCLCLRRGDLLAFGNKSKCNYAFDLAGPRCLQCRVLQILTHIHVIWLIQVQN
jgi:hypothetical protein